MTVVGIYLSNNFIYVFSFLRSDSIRLFFIDPRWEIWGRMVIEKVVELPADLFWVLGSWIKVPKKFLLKDNMVIQ